MVTDDRPLIIEIDLSTNVSLTPSPQQFSIDLVSQYVDHQLNMDNKKPV